MARDKRPPKGRNKTSTARPPVAVSNAPNSPSIPVRPKQKPPKPGSQSAEATGHLLAAVAGTASGSNNPNTGGIPIHPHQSIDGLAPFFPAKRPDSDLRKRRNSRFGWVRDIPDFRDHLYAAPLAPDLPARWSLQHRMPPVYDQGDLGTCTANALAAAIQFEWQRVNAVMGQRVPSRLFIYYNERDIEGTLDVDCGAQLRDGIKTIAARGVCLEGTAPDEWDYNVAKVNQRPPTPCFRAALSDRVLGYSRLHQSLVQMRTCLASGFPFVFGFTAYESFENAPEGQVQMPACDETEVGGHAVVAVGYDDSTQRFECRNSWGIGWGDRGYFTIPYAYLTSAELAGDFWTIRLIDPPSAG